MNPRRLPTTPKQRARRSTKALGALHLTVVDHSRGGIGYGSPSGVMLQLLMTTPEMARPIVRRLGRHIVLNRGHDVDLWHDRIAREYRYG